MRKILIAFVVFFGLCTSVFASLEDVVNATVRIQDGQFMGTGTVFNVDDTNIYILTNAHVAEHENLEVQFYKDGRISQPVPGKTIWRDFVPDSRGEPSRPRDVAIVVVAKAASPVVPKPIGIDLKHDCQVGETIVTMGHPSGEWPKLLRTTISTIEDEGRTMTFEPVAEPGQSGSGIFDADGDHIIGLLAWRGPGPINWTYTRAMTAYELNLAWRGKVGAATPIESTEEIVQGWRATPGHEHGSPTTDQQLPDGQLAHPNLADYPLGDRWAVHVQWHLRVQGLYFTHGYDVTKLADVKRAMAAGWNSFTDPNMRWAGHVEECHTFNCQSICPPGGGG